MYIAENIKSRAKLLQKSIKLVTKRRDYESNKLLERYLY